LLSKSGRATVQGFFADQAHPLYRTLYHHHMCGHALESVYQELAAFQNDDGGFGHGLEPDIRLTDSSVIATTVGLQILRRLGAPESHPLVTGAISYLLETYDFR
jgi:hypothetical protein